MTWSRQERAKRRKDVALDLQRRRKAAAAAEAERLGRHMGTRRVPRPTRVERPDGEE